MLPVRMNIWTFRMIHNVILPRRATAIAIEAHCRTQWADLNMPVAIFWREFLFETEALNAEQCSTINQSIAQYQSIVCMNNNNNGDLYSLLSVPHIVVVEIWVNKRRYTIVGMKKMRLRNKRQPLSNEWQWKVKEYHDQIGNSNI